MDLKNIISLPNPTLRKKSKKIGVIDNSITDLVENMKQATLSWEDSRQHEVGVALAAVQVDSLKKVIIVRKNFEDKSDRSFDVFINPKITKLSGEVIEDYEGCLSIKNIYGKVPRHDKVKLTAQNIDGKEIRLTAEGFLARVFQHEIDHTKGTVFIDHIKDNPGAFFTLMPDGALKSLDYDKEIKQNHILW
jgi:peptide deformylase